MTNSKRHYVIALSLLSAFFALVCLSYFSMDTSAITIDGEPIHGITGVGLAIGGVVIGCIATFFALGVTGIVLAGVSIFLIALCAFIAGAILLAIIPALLPLLILVGIISLLARKK
ncbi:hypothetical protein LPB67_08465 [Undibacterium sp. Jales W-56]|uniref:hypothetical protein n=1 Tax=Undibacterium sp. Jales W-56 TaxID=2897325 RepID=UPI0021D139C0|nr:hypothetical protein [Undibacterium sp. Jales W-56]MCU6433809.1 hypothetical protein [Undibacterium sp. Jales W-56]